MVHSMSRERKMNRMDDLISRQAAIELWEQYHPYIAVKACEYDKKLRSLPSAERHGRWIETTVPELWECSVCGCVIYSETEIDREHYHKWCGRCGAKMDEEEPLKMPPDDGSTIPVDVWKMDEVEE